MGCEVHAYFLMSNHYHSLIGTPTKQLGEKKITL